MKDMRVEFKRQAAFTHLYNDSIEPRPLVEVVKEYVLFLHREADEILDTVPWKPHRHYADPSFPSEIYPSEDTLNEAVDVIKFALGLIIQLGYTYDEFLEAFSAKTTLVQKRWDDEHAS